MEQKFLEFVADIMEVEVSRLSLDTEYKFIEEWDSLMHVRLMAEICDEYNVDINIGDMSNIKCLRDFYKYIEK